jgi:hypothetical protein
MSARGFLGAGDVYMNPIVDGVPQGWVGPYEATKFEIKPNVELREQISKGKNTYGQVIESVALQQPADLTVDFAEVNKETMRTALLGTAKTASQAAGNVSNEALTAKLGVWVPTSKFAISNVVVTNAAGTTTYVEGEDYIVNEDLGWVKALEGGDITADQPLQVDFSYAAKTADDIEGATQADVRVKFKFDGKNQVDGLPVQVDVYEAVIAADSAFDFLADEFNTVSLPGRMKTPTGFTHPFKVRQLRA